MKKGFTIIELITVIILLSLISTFTFPTVNKTIKNRKEALYNIQIDNIKSSAVSYIDKNSLLKDNDKVIVTLCQLKQNGYTDEKIKNPINGTYIPDDSKVVVTKDEKIFIYGTDGYTECTKTDTTLFEYVEVGTEYKETIDMSLYNVTIYKDNNIVTKIDSKTIGTYFIEFKSSTKNINKYVYIVDTTNPDIKYKNKVNKSYEIGESVITIETNQGLFNPYEVVVTDNSGEIIEPIIGTNVNLKIPGDYYISYTATDSSLNSITKIQRIKVQDTKAPIIESIDGNPEYKTSMSAQITINAYDEGVGLHPLGAYSFDGGKTWQTENSITVDENINLEIVVRDAVGNETKHTEKITNILKDDKNLSFTITRGTLKNNGWFVSDVEVLVKPLVSSEYFSSFTYCIGTSKCTPNKTSLNYNGETVKLDTDTMGTLICGKVNKTDGSSTDIICSTLFKIDKSVPSVSYKFISGEQNTGYKPWYTSDVVLEPQVQSISGIEKIEYCTTTGNSCTPNKIITGSNPRVILSGNSKTNKVCSIITNISGNKSQNTCSVSYQIDKTTPTVSISVSGDNYGDYIGKKVTLTANPNPTTTVSGYTYTWYKNGNLVQSGTSNILNISNSDDLSQTDTYKVEVITGAGNKGESSKKLTVDTVKPTCSFTINGTKGNDNWYVSNKVTIIGNHTDKGSGILSIGTGLSLEYNSGTTYTIETNTAGTKVYCSVKDKVGNEGSNSIDIKKDSEAPTCVFTENNKWTNNAVKITSTCLDLVSGCTNDSNWEKTYTGVTTIKTDSHEYIINDKAGNSATCSQTYNVYYDNEKPTCTVVNSPDGNNGWYKSSSPTINVAFDDGKGEISDTYVSNTAFTSKYNGASSYTLTENTTGTKVYCSVKDKAGNVGDSYETIKKDDGSGRRCEISGENNNWTKETVTVSYYVNTSVSKFSLVQNGISSNLVSQKVEGGTVANANLTQYGLYAKFFGDAEAENVKFEAFTLELESGAIIKCDSKTVNVYYDGVKPTCNVNSQNSTWTNNNVDVKIKCLDSGSGCTTDSDWTKTYTGVTTVEKDSYEYTIKDKAGNSTTCSKSYDVYYDGVKPTCNVSSQNSTWTNNNVNIKIKCSDLGSGCTTDSDWTKTYTGVTTVEKDSYEYTIKDKAGNSTTCSKSYDVYYDGEEPKCNYTENDKWTNTNVTIKNTCSDLGSGCKTGFDWSKEYNDESTVATFNHKNTIYDNAGNEKICNHEYKVYYDKVAPTCKVEFTSSSTPYGVSGKVIASDESGGSGIKGSSIETFENLTETKTYSFYDNAGNSTTCTVKVTQYTQYGKSTCDSYNKCTNASFCGTTESCSCVAGWGPWQDHTKYDTNRICEAQMPAGIANVKEYRCMVSTLQMRVWESCASKTCTTIANECNAPGCGCASWGSVEWTDTNNCDSTQTNIMKCTTRTIYKGE